jgi:putative flippase GtrA
MALISRILRFGSVGAVGYVVDSSVLLLLAKGFGVAPLPARIMSFIVAATVTFLLNKRFTFALRERFSVYRWSYYILATGLGALVNVGVYHEWIVHFGTSAFNLVAGTAAGSVVAMCLNFFVSQRFVFAPQGGRSVGNLSERTP